ncbi:protein transport protein SEC31-like [Mustela putorius furo]|uniref:Protein transport protein SEC31-like n=1 Tax=Mustela putorius furo TaxID=9669 RepID=A0A8U0RH55_MUSPF|nr:protein transport protein SEC31-like [Mustela putorius furo]
MRSRPHTCASQRANWPACPSPPTHDAEQFTQVPEQGVRRRSGSQGDQRQLPEKCSAEHRGLGWGESARGGGEPPPPRCASRSAPWLPSAVTEAAGASQCSREARAEGRGLQGAPRWPPAPGLSRPPRGPGAALGPVTEPVAGPGHPASTLLSQKRLNDTQDPLQDAAQGATQVTHPKVPRGSRGMFLFKRNLGVEDLKSGSSWRTPGTRIRSAVPGHWQNRTLRGLPRLRCSPVRGPP